VENSELEFGVDDFREKIPPIKGKGDCLCVAVTVIASQKIKNRLPLRPSRRVTSVFNATLLKMPPLRRPRRNAAARKCRRWINPAA
jgi:hypothetical protein